MTAISRKADCDPTISPRQARMSGLGMLQGGAKPALSGRYGPSARARGCPAPFPAPGRADRREEPIPVICRAH